MSLFTRKKPVVEPTLAELHEFAHIQANRALGVFNTVVRDLEASADQHNEVAEHAQAEAEKLLALKDAAMREAIAVRRQASAIGALLSS